LADHALESEILAGLTVTAPAPLVVSDEVRRILRIEVPVIVKLAEKRLPLGEIIDLCPGSIVEFAKSADTPLDLLVNNKPIGRGLAVKVGEKFGLRIDEILPVEETIRSLGV
jgi:flagellar motor switch protein FliN/FliY